MKRTFFFLMMAVAILSSCQDQNEPDFTTRSSSGSGGGGGTQPIKSASFNYQQTAPFTITFTNTSSNISSFKWDFGDGTTSTEKSPIHKYSKEGKYLVTMTGDGQYECKANITINKPQIYVAGWKLYNIPYQNKYYKLKMYDDDWFSTEWGFETVYTKSLSNSDLPYAINFSTPKIMDKLDGDNYYNVKLIYSSNTSSDGTICFNGRLEKSTIYTYKSEYTWTSSDGKTKFSVLMEYR